MAFSSFSMALAAGDAVVVEATQSNEQMAGDFLKTAGVLKGDDKGNLNLDQALTREQAMLMIAKLMGKEDEALNFKGESTFKDAKNNAYWAPVIAWAEAQKLTNGMGDGTFGLGKEATQNQVVTMYLRVLGYEVTWEGKELSADSQKVVEETGLLTAIGDTFNRGAMAVMTVNTLKATPKGAEAPLAKNLNVDMTKAPKFVTPSVPGEIGDAKVTSAKAIANDKIEVKFDKEVNAAAADFKVTEKADATKVIEVKEAKMESAKVAVLTVEGLTSGKAYTVKVGETTVNFTGIAKVTAAPVVKTVKGTDFNRVEIEFEKTVDKETAETVANYTIEKATVVKATLNADRNKVTLETEGLVKNTLYKVTIENVKSVDMTAMKKTVKSFRATEDTATPKVLSTKFINSETVQIKFSKEMDKATLEDVANYSIPNLDVVSAKASDDAKTNDTVTLKTATQDVKVTYTMTVTGLKDASVKANALAKFSRTFRGVAVDNIAPAVTKVEAISNTLLKVEVSERNLMDANSIADVTNYAIDKDITVVSAELVESTNDYEKVKEILITTTPQDKGVYRLTVKGIMDEFSNPLKAISGTNYRQYSFVAGKEIVAPLKVAKIQPNGLNKIVVTFDKEADKATAQDPTNYMLNGDLGVATKATLSSTDAKVVTLETATQKAGTKYTVTINGVQYKYVPTAVTVDLKASFIALATEADITAPTLAYAYAVNRDEVHLVFSEAMKGLVTDTKITAGSVTLTYKDIIAEDSTLVFKTGTQLGLGNYALTTGGVEFKDLAGNKYQPEAADFYGSNVENVGPVTSASDIEQVNASKIKVTFDKNIAANPVVTASVSGSFSAERDDDNHNVMYITTTGTFPINSEITFTVTATDMIGEAFRGLDNTTKQIKFTPYISATEAPVMINAVAINNKKVELTFNETLKTPGSYKIEYVNADGKYVAAPFTATPSLDKDKVTLTLSSAMDANEVYYVKYLSAAVNLGGKAAVTKDFEMSFNGTAVEANNDYIGGVSFSGSQTVIVYDQSGNKVTPASIKIGTVDVATEDGYKAEGTKIIGYFQQDKTYTVAVDGLGTFDFAGILASANAAKGVTLGDVTATAGTLTPGTKEVATISVTGSPSTNGSITVDGQNVVITSGAAATAIVADIQTALSANWAIEIAGSNITATAITAGDKTNMAVVGTVADLTVTSATTVEGTADVISTGSAIVSVLSGASESGNIVVRVGEVNVTVTVAAGDTAAKVAETIAAAINNNITANTKYIASSNGEVLTVVNKTANEPANATAITIAIN